MNLMIFVDGDNNPDFALRGIEYLKTGDEVYIYESIAKGGKHFKEEYIKELQSKTAAKINVRFIQTIGKNATDFRVAIDAARAIAAAEDEKKAYVLVSGDSDFVVIASELRVSCPNLIISAHRRVLDPVRNYWPLLAENAEDVKKYIQIAANKEIEEDAYENLAAIFSSKRPECTDVRPSNVFTSGNPWLD